MRKKMPEQVLIRQKARTMAQSVFYCTRLKDEKRVLRWLTKKKERLFRVLHLRQPKRALQLLLIQDRRLNERSDRHPHRQEAGRLDHQ